MINENIRQYVNTEDKEFYRDKNVRVTANYLAVGSTIYNLTGIKYANVEEESRKSGCCVIWILLVIFSVIFVICMPVVDIFLIGIISAALVIFFIIIALLIAGILSSILSYIWSRINPTTYVLLIMSAGGKSRTKVLYSKDNKYLKQIAIAIENAINYKT